MPYRVTWQGKPGSKFSFSNPDKPEEKVILSSGESRKFSAKPECGKPSGLYIEDLDPKEEIVEEKAEEEKPKEKKKAKRKKKSLKKGSMGNTKIE